MSVHQPTMTFEITAWGRNLQLSFHGNLSKSFIHTYIPPFTEQVTTRRNPHRRRRRRTIVRDTGVGKRRKLRRNPSSVH